LILSSFRFKSRPHVRFRVSRLCYILLCVIELDLF
jgi:hypothetical protein